MLTTYGLRIGEDSNTGMPVYLPDASRTKGAYLLGATGSGKSNFLICAISHDIDRGVGVVVLDPKGDLIVDVIDRIPADKRENVVLLDVNDSEYPFALNVFDCADVHDEELVARAAEQVVELFKKGWEDISWGPRLEDLLRLIAYVLVSNPTCAMTEVPLLLQDPAVRSRLLDLIDDPVCLHFWKEEYGERSGFQQEQHYQSTMNKVRAFLINPIIRRIVGQSHNLIDFRECMDQGKIVLINLAEGRVGRSAVNILGSTIVAQIYNAAMSRSQVRAEGRYR